MNANFLRALADIAKVAGIAGIALVVFLALFRDFIRKKIFAQLTKEHSYKLLRLFLLLVSIITFISIVGYFVIKIVMPPPPSPPAMGQLHIISDPSNAEIIVDNGNIGKLTPCIFDLYTGKHTVVLNVPKYFPETLIVDIKKDQTHKTDTIRLSKRPATGSIHIVTAYPNVEIFLNNQRTNQTHTPVTFEGLMAGSNYWVKIIRPYELESGFVWQYSCTASVKGNSITNIVLDSTRWQLISL